MEVLRWCATQYFHGKAVIRLKMCKIIIMVCDPEFSLAITPAGNSLPAVDWINNCLQQSTFSNIPPFSFWTLFKDCKNALLANKGVIERNDWLHCLHCSYNLYFPHCPHCLVFEFWLKLWNAVAIVKYAHNCEIWSKVWNFVKIMKFGQNF